MEFTLTEKQGEAMDLLTDNENGVTEVLFGGSAGGGKCVSFDTQVHTTDGRSVMIKDILPGDDIYSIDNDCNVVEAKVIAKVNTGEKRGFKFSVFGGDDVTVSEDHPFIVYNDGNPKWVFAKDLKKGMCVGVPQFEPHSIIDDKYSLDMYELFGYLIGNGGLTNGVGISMAQNGSLDRLKELIPEGYVLKKRKSAEYDYGIRYFKHGKNGSPINPLLDEIRRLGLNTKSKHKSIPSEFFNISDKAIFALLSGIIATDGYITDRGIGVTFASKQLIYDIRRLFLRVGVFGNVRYKLSKCGDKCFDAWELKITRYENYKILAENCNFAHKMPKLLELVEKKQTMLMGVNYEYTHNNVRFRRIKSIEDVGMVEMYDIETSSGSFIGNNIILHNSLLACIWIITMCLTYPGTRYLMGRAVLKALKETTLRSFFDVCDMMGLRKDEHWTFNTKDNIIKFSKDLGSSEIFLKDLFQYPSDPEFDSLGSLEITGAIIDEVSQISKKAKDIVMSRIRYKLDKYGLIPKMLLVTNPAKNWAYSQFYKPYKEGTLIPYRRFIPALPGDNKFLSKHYVSNLEKLDDAEKQRLLMGNWEYDDDPSVMIPYAKIVDVFRPKESLGQRYISADIARMGRDKTVIGVWEGLNLIRIETMARNKVTEAADLINQLRYEHRVHSENICIDADGIGGGTLDMIDGAVGIVNNSIAIKVEGSKENFGNLKSQLYFYLAEYINKGRIYVRCTAEERELIVQELEQVKKMNVDKDGRFHVIPKQMVKDLIGRSPDYSDMMAYRMWFELNNQSRYV